MIHMGDYSYCPRNDIDCYEEVDLTIGKFCSIGSGLKILSGKHACIENPEVVATYPFREQWDADYPPCKMGGKVTIGNDVWIATDVSILEGVTIGDGAIIGAKSVIGSDVPPYTVAIGNPWRVLRKRFTEEQIKKLIAIKWWLWQYSEIEEALPYMKNIETFLERYSA